MVVLVNNCQDCLSCFVLINEIGSFSLSVCEAESHVIDGGGGFYISYTCRGRVSASDLHNLWGVFCLNCCLSVEEITVTLW